MIIRQTVFSNDGELHPCDVKEESIQKELRHVEKMLEKEKFIAVGEIGLDLYWDKSTF